MALEILLNNTNLLLTSSEVISTCINNISAVLEVSQYLLDYNYHRTVTVSSTYKDIFVTVFYKKIYIFMLEIITFVILCILHSYSRALF
jgi:hypothetical protein